MDKTTNDRERTVLTAKIAEHGVAGVAEILGVNSAHISNGINRRHIGPTLRRAMIAAGWLEQPDPYPWFKIARDPEHAALLISERVARGDLTIEWLNDFVVELYRLNDPDFDVDDWGDKWLLGNAAVVEQRERIKHESQLDVDAIDEILGNEPMPKLRARPIVHMGQPVKRRRGVIGNAQPVIIRGNETDDPPD